MSPWLSWKKPLRFGEGVEGLVVSCDYSVLLTCGQMIGDDKMSFFGRQRFLQVKNAVTYTMLSSSFYIVVPALVITFVFCFAS